jgi:DNA-binding protein H-NS
VQKWEDDEGAGEDGMKEFDPELMSVDELWELHERISQALCVKIRTEQEKLQSHLSRLRSGITRPKTSASSAKSTRLDQLKRARLDQLQKARKPYPKVKPKYRSLEDPSLTWAGRGKQPRWLIAEMIKGGKPLDDFLIASKASSARKKAPLMPQDLESAPSRLI